MPNRKIIVNVGTSADGFIARPNGDINWLTSRPKPAGFYDMAKFTASIDTKILGRKTYEKSLELGAKFDGKTKTYVISAHAPATSVTEAAALLRAKLTGLWEQLSVRVESEPPQRILGDASFRVSLPKHPLAGAGASDSQRVREIDRIASHAGSPRSTRSRASCCWRGATASST